jgi:Mu transposase, C-terminal domain
MIPTLPMNHEIDRVADDLGHDLDGLLDQCIAHAKANKHPEQTERTIWQVFEAERTALVPIAGAFDRFRATQAAVSKTCLVRFDNNKYSVSARAVGRSVEVQAGA